MNEFNLDDMVQSAKSRISYAVEANANYELLKIKREFAKLRFDHIAKNEYENVKKEIDRYANSMLLQQIHPYYGMMALNKAIAGYEKLWDI